MELRLDYSAAELAHTRFALSPLWEAIASLRVLSFPAEHPLHHPWERAVRPRLTGLDLRPLTELITPGLIAAFVCPPPVSHAPDLELELATLRAQPHDRVQAGLEACGLRHPDPAGRLDELAGLVRAYWDIAIAPYWPRIRALLDGDVLHRARLMATSGARGLFEDLDPGITWQNDTLHVRRRRQRAAHVRLEGQGVLLIPSVFAHPRVFSLTAPGWQPLLRYPVRGVATLWESKEAAPPHAALAKVLGRSRALLLSLLDQPATTTTLAARTGLTSGAVSQHLTAMRDAGLLTAHRLGKEVLYARTTPAHDLTDRALSR